MIDIGFQKMQFISQASETVGRERVWRIAGTSHIRKATSFVGFFGTLTICGWFSWAWDREVLS